MLGERQSVGIAGVRYAVPIVLGALAACGLAACSSARPRTATSGVEDASATRRDAAAADSRDAAAPGVANVGGDADARPVSDAGPVDTVDTVDSGVDSTHLLSPEQLRDPASCKPCHPAHYQEWSSSMHAYAALDPVFVAMNKRGQRETNGALKDFCVRCHAPMAVADGLTQDGLNLDQLPDQKRGVSCYFCHNVVGIDSDHNGSLRIAGDNTMRGPIQDAVESGAHRSAYTEIFDHANPLRNAMCGGCHDIVTPTGVHLERTYLEYQSGLYAHRPSADAPALENCAGCHMPNRMAQASVFPSDAPARSVHEHLWPGVDVALTEFPNRQAMRAAIEDCQLGIGSVGYFTLEAIPPNTFTFKVETNSGHNLPSGSAQDRRMWLELLAYDADGNLLEASSSGNITHGEIVDKGPDDPDYDPQLWLFRDWIYDERGELCHMFWDAAPSTAYPSGYEANTLAVRKETLGVGIHYVERSFRATGADGTGTPARITARLRLRPIGLDVLQDLVATGDLDEELLQHMPTYTFGAQLEWTQADGFMKPISAEAKTDCVAYRCLLEPESKPCQ